MSTAQSLHDPAVFHLREATRHDDQALKKLISVPMTTRGVMISFQREPSYFKASDLLYKTKLHLVIEDLEKNKLVACYSNGYRPCYINGVIQQLRYACDLRIDQNYRGKSLLQIITADMRETMHEPNYSQLIIFNDNYAARAAIQTGKTGIPDYYDEGLIETLTLTGIKSSKQLNRFLQKYSVQGEIVQRRANIEDIPLMNAFIKEMSNYYNFIPAYHFEELIQQDPYFSGLKLSDFSLYLQNQKIIGIFGLWDQHSFKQTKILDYKKGLGLLRPFYNLYAMLTHGMHLPPKGKSFQYHALHSLLCHPENLALHHQMIQDAYTQSKEKGIGAICFSLSHKDPRYQLNQFYHGETLVGMHGFVSFKANPLKQFTSNLIPYIEVGRI